MDFMDGNVSLIPSYMRVLVKYQKVVEPRVLEGSTIKRRDEEHVLAEVEKIHRKLESGQHVQKNRMIYREEHNSRF